MSIQSEIDRLKTAKSGLATAITGKGVTVPGDATLSEYPALVDQIQTSGGGGGGGNEPVPPSTDGKTRLYITVSASAMEGEPPPRADVPLYIRQTVANGVSIDWGDGSAAETLSGTGNVNTTHHYNAAGDYVIALTVAEGCELGLGWETSSYCVMGSTNNSDSSNGASGYRTTLKMCSIGSGVTIIGNSAFSACHSLSSVNIPDNVTSIGNYAFYYCHSLSSVNIPDSVTIIGNSAFSDCYSLSSVNIPDSVTSIGSDAFYSCYSLSSVNIPDSVTSIGNGAFYSCYSLSSVNIPDNVTSIGDGAFDSCYSLSSVNIPDSVTSIGNGAFYSCYSLSSVNIPDNVTSIGNSAFYYCYSFKYVYFNSNTPPAIQSDTFNNIANDCIFSIPAGSLSAYQSATNYTGYAFEERAV